MGSDIFHGVDGGISGKLFTWNHLGRMGMSFAEGIVSSLCLLRIPLRRIIGFCALLLRMEIFGGFSGRMALLSATFFALDMLTSRRRNAVTQYWVIAEASVRK